MEEAKKYQWPDTAKDLKISNMRNAATIRKSEGNENYDELEPDISVHHTGKFDYVDYLPPEATGNASQGLASACKLTATVDIFSAGMIIAEMLGVRPLGHRLTKDKVRPLTDHDICDLAGCCTSCRKNWKKISKKGRDVIKELTNANFKERPSAKAAVTLVSEWVNQLEEDERRRQRDERKKLKQEELKRQYKAQRSKSTASQNRTEGERNEPTVRRKLTIRYGSESTKK
ncbi:uncharacterized protein FOMMEDRAFT_162068 [Fomitiporia mediterranea MF3/22]|uniref:uncharacterized protein n=1 Tax=Fomitiporia mediterranea (strain MF3/22) TaxID=694068 RepID=UPI000440928D|nr:uncharacterized protein FOMMEDRAFT_162068 [Fomitiporia mediterranea MF3/22]EJC98297.1 hypothetical protein FOMMEDRAFT_162068 [Fomitiporia mediterranea MF3/22]